MRKLLILIVILALALPCYAAINSLTTSIDSRTTWVGAYAWTGNPTKDKCWDWAVEMEDFIDGTVGFQSIYFNPETSAPTATEGRMYYNDSDNAWIGYNGTTWQTFDVAGGGTLNAAYDSGGAGSGKTITATDGAVTIANTEADSAALLSLSYTTGAQTGDALLITISGGTADGIEFENTGTGYDIEGTGGLWYATKAGVGTFAGLIVGGTDIVMENADTFNNVDDDVFEFDSNDKEDFEIDLTGTNIVKFTSDTSAVTLEFDTLDRFTGVETIDFDAAAGDLTLTADAGAEDFTVQQAGSVDASLVLYSAGTGTDAVKMYAAKGIDIDSVDDMAITNTASTDADDLVITQTGTYNSSLLLTSAGTGTDALSLITTNASGDIEIMSADLIDIDAVDDITVDISGTGKNLDIDSAAGSIYLDAGEADAKGIWLAATGGGIDIDTVSTYDVDIDAVGGKFLVTATEDAANTIALEENGGTSGSINIYSNQGTGASATTQHDASIQLHSDDGGISLYTTGDVADAVRIESNGGTSETININNLQGTGAGAITISANAAGGDLNLQSVLGRIEIEAEEDVVNALYLIADGGTVTTLEIFNDTGTAVAEDAAAIQILADVGGITIQSDANLDDALCIRVDGGTTSEMTIHNDRGSAADSIEIVSDAGGIDISGGAGGDIDITSTSKSVVITATEAAVDAIKLVGATGAGGITFDAGSGGITCSGDTFKNYLKEIEIEAATTETVLAADSGKVFISKAGLGTVTYTLPTAAAGLTFTFIDGSATAADDLWITASSGDVINSGTAQKSYKSATDAIPASCTIVAVNAASWEVVAEVGTWANDNN